jgi:hypothetical protein
VSSYVVARSYATSTACSERSFSSMATSIVISCFQRIASSTFLRPWWDRWSDFWARMCLAARRKCGAEQSAVHDAARRVLLTWCAAGGARDGALAVSALALSGLTSTWPPIRGSDWRSGGPAYSTRMVAVTPHTTVLAAEWAPTIWARRKSVDNR